MRPLSGLWLGAALTLLGAAGCGPALDEPTFPSPSYEFDPPPPAPPPAPAQASAADDDIPPPAPRLRRSKTLGETTYDRGTAAPAAPGQGGTTVVIQNNIQQNSTTVVYGGALLPYDSNSGYGSAGRGASRPSGGASSPPPVGGDWPRVPSYGPR